MSRTLRAVPATADRFYVSDSTSGTSRAFDRGKPQIATGAKAHLQRQDALGQRQHGIRRPGNRE